MVLLIFKLLVRAAFFGRQAVPCQDFWRRQIWFPGHLRHFQGQLELDLNSLQILRRTFSSKSCHSIDLSQPGIVKITLLYPRTQSAWMLCCFKCNSIANRIDCAHDQNIVCCVLNYGSIITSDLHVSRHGPSLDQRPVPAVFLCKQLRLSNCLWQYHTFGDSSTVCLYLSKSGPLWQLQ